MTSDKKKELLEILAKFTYYEVEDLEISDDTIKFRYLSVFGDIICQCELHEDSMYFKLDNNEWIRLIKSNDIILDLEVADRVFNYLNNLAIIDRVNVEIKSLGNNYIFKFSKLNMKKAHLYLERYIALIDKIILNILLLIDNKSSTNLNKEVCIYPGFRDGIDRVSNVYILSKEYINYMSDTYRKDILYTPLNSGVELDKGYSFLDFNSMSGYWSITNIRTTRAKLIGEVIIPTRNLIKIIRYLGKITLYDDTYLVIKDEVLKLVSDAQINIGVVSRQMYPNVYLSSELCGYEVDICRVIGDTPILNSRNEIIKNILVTMVS